MMVVFVFLVVELCIVYVNLNFWEYSVKGKVYGFRIVGCIVIDV